MGVVVEPPQLTSQLNEREQPWSAGPLSATACLLNTGNGKQTTINGFETKAPGQALQPRTHEAHRALHQPQEPEGWQVLTHW